MKHVKQIMVICFFFATMAGSSQELSRQVISAGGGQSKSGPLDLSWTLGQAGLVGTFNNSNVELCAGFHQFDVLLDGVNEQLTNSTFKVYPNPFNDYFVLEMLTENSASVTLNLYDCNGKLWHTKVIQHEPTVVQETIDIQGLPRGVYYLNIMVESKGSYVTNQLIKLIH